MDFELSTEHQALRDTVRALLDRLATDRAVAEWDASETFPADLYRRLAAVGICGLTVEERYGGSGRDYVAVCVVVAELARVSAALTWSYLTTVSVAASAIARFGSQEQRDVILPGIVAGHLRLAIALTEPEAGSDLGALTTSATRADDGWRVTGQKVFTTGADSSELLLTLVRTDRARRMNGALTFVLIDPSSPGVQIRALPKMAGQAIHTCEVFLDDVAVSDSDVVGSVGGGAEILMAALDSERVATAAMGLGVAEGSLAKALAYAEQRQQFGVAIIDHQAVGHLLADMVIDADTARLLTYRAAALLQEGRPCSREAAVAKVAASEIGTRCANRGMQVLGGYSYMTEYGMERYWREAKLYEIAAGTNQILRDAIVGHLRLAGGSRGATSP